MINLKKIQDLPEKVAGDAHLLYEALADSTLESTSTVLSLLETAQNYVMSIGEAALKAELSGLPMFCQQTCQQLAEFAYDPVKQNSQFTIVLERWPRLVSNYLYLKADKNSCNQLVNYLQNVCWTPLCSNEQADELRDGLSQDFGNVDKETTTFHIPDSQFPIPSSKFSELYNLIVEKNHVLSVALNRLMTSDTESEAFLEGIEHYTETIQLFWDFGEKLGLSGICEVCEFINENVFECSLLSQTKRLKLLEQFTLWPQLLLDYLQIPDLGVEKLVEFSCAESWPVSMPKEKATNLLTQLGQDISIETKVQPLNQLNSKNEKPVLKISARLISDMEETTFVPAQLNVEDLPPQKEKLPQQLDIEDLPLQKGEELPYQLSNTDDQLPESLVPQQLDTENLPLQEEELPYQLSNTDDQLPESLVPQQLDTENLPLQEEELPYQLSNTDDQLLESLVPQQLDAEDLLPQEENLQTTDDQLLEPETLVSEQILRQENDLPTTEFQMPNQETLESEQLDAEDLSPQNSYDNQISENNDKLLDQDILDLLIAQINEVAEENGQFINHLIETEDGSEALLMAAMSYTENVQSVWDAAEMASLGWLQEFCTFVNDNVMVLGGLPKALRESARQVLLEWPTLVVAYLRHPNDTLPTFMQNANWPSPLDDESVVQLQQLFSKSHKEDSYIPDVTTTQPIHHSPSQPLAAPDIVELVIGQITDSIDGLSAALEVCISMENENEAFLEAIENYTNQVQDVWDAAEMAGLSGLQEVCTFINDNLMALINLDKSQKLATQTYFIDWPIKVLEYLQSPAIGASQLVIFMQEPGWPVPLDEEATANLLTLLTKPAVTEVEDANETPVPDTVALEPVVEKTDAGTVPPLDMDVSDEISLGSGEILEILSSELDSAKEDLATQLNKVVTLTDTEATEAVENYTELMQRLYAAAEMLGLEGLQSLCTFIITNITALVSASADAKLSAKKVLESWPDLVLAYLHSPGDSVIPMVNHLREPEWLQPLSDDAALELLKQLTAGSTVEDEPDPENVRQTTATPEDVFLAIPEDVHPELLEAYLQEAPQHAQDFSACIQNIITEPDVAEIERAQRIAHTLKGSSNIIGVKGIANIAHHLEDTLEYLAKHQVVPPKELTDTMVEAADCLEIMVDSLLGKDEPPQQAQPVLQAVLDWANRIDKGKLEAPKASADSGTDKAPAPVAVSKQPAADTAKKPVAASTPEQFLKVPTKTIDELMRLVGELSISMGQIQERLKHVVHNTRSLTEQDLILQKKTYELENLVDVRGVTGIESNAKTSKDDAFNPNFDALEFEEYNELHSVAHSFIESIADNRELAMLIRDDLGELEIMFIHQERLNKEFQTNIMTTRMVPVTTIISKLQRNIRQTSRMTGKKTELDIKGANILIDSNVLNSLGDPLQHILRNAVDHGIEAADERSILGKPETGLIKLSFYREGNNIVVKCEDDGQGLNYTNIRYTAIQRGLITEHKEVTEQELARLILMSGFSTKSGVTQVSGRGVGMDVVHTNIRQMKGTLDLTSETGKGTTIVIKLPMTLVTVHVLLVRVGNSQFGIPTNNLEQALPPGVGEFYQVGDEITLKIDKNIYTIRTLASLLNLAADEDNIDEHETRPIILVREETGVTAIVVDELLDTHDLVMKSMGKYVTNINGVTGASILGDGSLVPLLDLPQLLRSPMQAAMGLNMAERNAPDEIGVGAPAIPHVMIVDDSLSVRKSLSLLVEDAGFDVLLAKDGLEAIEVMNQTRPNVMLVDMEMPRMNGLELTAHVRANQVTQDLPIFMITSRTTEKHREQAKAAGVNAYLTKPYQDAELLNLIDNALAGHA